MAEQSLFMTNVYKDGENMYKVIVAEDERLIRSYICDFINEYVDGFCVAKSFMDGRDVLEYLAEHSVHVIVTDIRMLEISGIEVARYVYEQHLPIRVILLSGYQDFGYAQEAIDYHVQSYLTKPVDPAELQKSLEKIKQQLDESAKSAEQTLNRMPSGQKEGSLDEQLMIERALSYMNQNYDKDISLRSVADYVYLSEDYFGRLFKKNTGSNFSAYLLSLRMRKAIELLKTGRFTVQEVGEKTGYKSTNYFIKVFREYTGYTPKKYPRFLEENHEN